MGDNIMTIERLNQYRQLIREIKYYEDLLNKINKPSLRDSVQSSDGPGNTLHETSIYGEPGGKQKIKRRYERYKKRAEKERDIIESYIESVNNSEMRMIMYYRFIEKTSDNKPLSWQAVAMRMNWTDESTPRQKFFDYTASRNTPKKI